MPGFTAICTCPSCMPRRHLTTHQSNNRQISRVQKLWFRFCKATGVTVWPADEAANSRFSWDLGTMHLAEGINTVTRVGERKSGKQLSKQKSILGCSCTIGHVFCSSRWPSNLLTSCSHIAFVGRCLQSQAHCFRPVGYGLLQRAGIIFVSWKRA